MSVFFRGVGGREGVVDDFCQARKAKNTDPRTNYAVKYATARGRLNLMCLDAKNVLKELFLSILGGLWQGEGGAHGTVPQQKLSVTSHILHREVPRRWYQAHSLKTFLASKSGDFILANFGSLTYSCRFSTPTPR